MSASREKKLRQDQTASGYVDPKAEKELEKKKAEKRSNVLYSVIAVLFVLVVAASFLWRSNVISRNATALTIDGEKYSAAEVNFYYQNVYRGFLQSNSYFISYLGLDTNASLKSQTVNATAASMMGVEEGSSWHDYIMDNTVKQMTMVQRGLKQAQEEGYQFPASVQEQYEDSLNSLKTSAESTGMSVKAYLQRNLGAIMTEKVYNQQVLRMLQYQAYAQSYSDSLTYTDAELEAAYQADPKTYDKAAWEYVVVSGAADSTTDADGNTVQATDEEQAAAKETAKATAEEILAAYNSGKSLESIAGNYEKATYYNTTDATYYDGVVGNWLFDDARKDGDTEILEVGTNYYVGLFHSRGREEYKTVDIRHILITPETGTKAQGDEGYEDEQTQLKAAARTKAEEILAQWKSGEATEDSFTEDGWYKTGDLGRIDDDGFLYIIGRKKDLIITAGGKNVSPGPIEDVIKRCEFVSQALVLGDKRPFISALITLDEEALRPWLESKGLNRDMSMEEASSNAAVRAEVQKWVDQANEGVSRAESVRKFIILPEEFTQENGLMTASMKVIRPKVIKRYSTLLNTQMYTKRK